MKLLKVFFLFFITLNLSYGQGNGISINLADSYFYKLNYDSAIEVYQNLLGKSPNEYEIFWKLARVYVNYGEVPGNEKKEYFNLAKEYAEKSVSFNPAKGEGYTFLAAAIGNLAYWGNNQQKIASAWQMITLLNQALSLNPNDPIALSIFGSLEHMLANVNWFERTLAGVIYNNSLPKGSYENAIKYLSKAISIDPTLIRHHYELALIYLDRKDYSGAKKEFQFALKCPIQLKADYRRIELINKHLKEIE